MLARLGISFQNNTFFYSEIEPSHFTGADDEIQEILLSQGQVISALKLAQENANPRKYLQSAQKMDDPKLFHSTFHYFKTKPQFAGIFKKDERLNAFVEHYNKLFHED